MKILAVDDEQIALRLLESKIKEVTEGAEVFSFSSATPALDFVSKNNVEIAFLDIELGTYNGVELAKKIKAKCPRCNIVFCTGYQEYMQSAFEIGASDYLQKPITAEKVKHAIEYLRYPAELKMPDDKLYIRCFGKFEVMWKGKPLSSMTKRAKELLAYLVDKKGALCSTKEILDAVYFDRSDVNMRIGRKELEQTLSEINQDDILIRAWGKMGIDTSKVVCDYYAYEDNVSGAISLYNGVYMEGYDFVNKTRMHLQYKK